MKHVVFYSGGLSSWMTAKLVIDNYGKENVDLLFTDTNFEDYDLYRFMDQTENGLDSEIIRLNVGMTPFDVFKKVKFMGNTRVDPCSEKLKREPARKYLIKNYNPEEVVLHFGFGMHERHRLVGGKNNKGSRDRYSEIGFKNVESLMTQREYGRFDDKVTQKQILSTYKIEIPRLYNLGFHHNNCSAFCPKAGIGHYMNLHKVLPEKYLEYEKLEEDVYSHIGSTRPFLRKTIKGVIHYLTLREFRKQYIEKGKCSKEDMFDIGGCGCFT